MKLFTTTTTDKQTFFLYKVNCPAFSRAIYCLRNILNLCRPLFSSTQSKPRFNFAIFMPFHASVTDCGDCNSNDPSKEVDRAMVSGLGWRDVFDELRALLIQQWKNTD